MIVPSICIFVELPLAKFLSGWSAKLLLNLFAVRIVAQESERERDREPCAWEIVAMSEVSSPQVQQREFSVFGAFKRKRSTLNDRPIQILGSERWTDGWIYLYILYNIYYIKFFFENVRCIYIVQLNTHLNNQRWQDDLICLFMPGSDHWSATRCSQRTAVTVQLKSHGCNTSLAGSKRDPKMRCRWQREGI